MENTLGYELSNGGSIPSGRTNKPINIFMNNYKELIALPTPVLPHRLLEIAANKHSYVHMVRDYKSLLNPALLDVLANLGLTPEFCTVFGRTSVQESKIWAHTDIRYVDNKWVKLPCGINWELVPSDTYFHWWDTKDAKECYPESADNTEWCEPDGFPNGQQGIHYGSRQNMDMSQFECLETLKYKFNVPYLVRADIPHSVEYKTNHKQRFGLSIRFPLDQIPTWDRAVEVLRPLLA